MCRYAPITLRTFLLPLRQLRQLRLALGVAQFLNREVCGHRAQFFVHCRQFCRQFRAAKLETLRTRAQRSHGFHNVRRLCGNLRLRAMHRCDRLRQWRKKRFGDFFDTLVFACVIDVFREHLAGIFGVTETWRIS